MKSSKTFCLLPEHAGPVPVLAELAAAAQVRHGVHAAGSTHGRRHDAEKAGVMLTLKPP